MVADLKKADDVVSKGMFTKIVKLFLEKNCMEKIRYEFRPQFMKCATFIVANEVIYCLILYVL
jgi:hypothetical protein